MAGPSYIQTYQDSLGVSVTNNWFTIDFVDSGTLHWTFERFSAGAQAVVGQSVKMELFYDADGTGNNLQLIDAIYTVGETYQHDFDTSVTYPYTINTSRVLLRRTLFGGILPTEVYAQWQGMVV